MPKPYSCCPRKKEEAPPRCWKVGGGVRVLGGSGDFVSGLIRGISRVTIWVIGVINLLNKSP